MRAAALLLTMTVVLGYAQTATLRSESAPEDPKLHAQAVKLVEEAVQASTPPTWTNVVIDTKIHLGSPAPGEPADGEHILTVGPWWKLRRHEWIWGSTHTIRVRNGDLFHMLVNEGAPPPFATWVENVMPIDLVRLNRQDVVYAMHDGPNNTSCIQFDTVNGESVQANEICVDKDRHWMTSMKLGDVLTVNSRFAPFADVFVPEHVERFVGGTLQFVFDQKVTARTEFPPDFFSVPENSTLKATSAACKEYRTPHPLNAPQPAPLSAAPTLTEIQVQGLVGVDGHITMLRPVYYLYPDLNDKAMLTVSEWTFTPASCDGKAMAWFSSFTVEFKGR